MDVMNPKLPEKAKSLLYDLSRGIITMEEFFLQIAEWVSEDCHMYKFDPVPAKPRDLEEFEKIPFEHRRSLPSEFFSERPQILNYDRLIKEIRYRNTALYEWLVECRGRLMKSDRVEQAHKVDTKLKEATVELLWKA